MRDHIEERVRSLAVYVLETGCTVREAAQRFQVSKSTVHKDLAQRLPVCHPALYRQVKEVLDRNKAERHLRGGDATRRKYEKKDPHVKG